MDNLDKISNFDWNFEIKVFEFFKLVCEKHVWGAEPLNRTFHRSSWISKNVWFVVLLKIRNVGQIILQDETRESYVSF